MFVWEMIECRLRNEGWSVWHAAAQDASAYTVYFHRSGFSGEASGPTLTDAYAEASRQARAQQAPIRASAGPHFTMAAFAMAAAAR
jgi:hypothetical protein